MAAVFAVGSQATARWYSPKHTDPATGYQQVATGHRLLAPDLWLPDDDELKGTNAEQQVASNQKRVTIFDPD
jgi:hypothetical protein